MKRALKIVGVVFGVLVALVAVAAGVLIALQPERPPASVRRPQVAMRDGDIFKPFMAAFPVRRSGYYAPYKPTTSK